MKTNGVMNVTTKSKLGRFDAIQSDHQRQKGYVLARCVVLHTVQMKLSSMRKDAL